MGGPFRKVSLRGGAGGEFSREAPVHPRTNLPLGEGRRWERMTLDQLDFPVYAFSCPEGANAWTAQANMASNPWKCGTHHMIGLHGSLAVAEIEGFTEQPREARLGATAKTCKKPSTRR